MSEPQESERKPRRHNGLPVRSIIPRTYGMSTVVAESLTDRVARWVAPWHTDHYPGKQRAFLSLLSRRVTWEAVKHWRAGRARLPRDAAFDLAAALERRCAAGLLLAAELRAYGNSALGPREASLGFRRVDEVTGRDKRHRSGNKPKAPDSDVDL